MEKLFSGAQAPFILRDTTLEGKVQIDRAVVARSYYDLAKVHYDKAALKKAQKKFLSSLEYMDFPRDVYLGLKTYGFLIRIASEQQQDQQVQDYIKKAEELAQSLTSILPSLNAEYFYNLASIANYRGNFISAKEHYLLACKKAKEENEPELLTKCLLSTARVCFSQNELHEAQDYLKQLEQLLKIIDKDYVAGSMYFLHGRVYLAMGKNDLAIKFFDQANESMKNKKCWNMLGQILLNKGRAFKNLGEFGKAMSFFELAGNLVDSNEFVRLSNNIKAEVAEVNDSSVDIYLDRVNRKISEKELGVIDFKHRFVLLEILFLLANNIGAYFDKDRLAKAIWKDEYNPLIHDKLIYTSVSRLRKLIEPKGAKSKRKYIIRGKDGYTFNPHVRIRFHSETSSERDLSMANIDMSSPV